ncbi:hypothetical protein OB955_25160 [Halobacteria archaeon AArc-m2/3/4]|uniref:Uncharacterized protein n=1 Tax=Natronoglomus mannanivorans TaxID=2979990 RepID=A0AAP2Z3D8_9EURY|nr:hypothetical protein [Halobacteria archaeon AArc-xg1-1]MCU4975967.1 hypothetical protein [Halobacteria archaeon AArc-m2/3/4]
MNETIEDDSIDLVRKIPGVELIKLDVWWNTAVFQPSDERVLYDVVLVRIDIGICRISISVPVSVLIIVTEAAGYSDCTCTSECLQDSAP